jgi:hypothetical protein
MPDEPPVTTRNAAWMAYQERLGNLTTREENMLERAFKAGWLAALSDGKEFTAR